MAKRSSAARGALNNRTVIAPELDEAEHFHRCDGCGQFVDRRSLGDVLHHEEPGHEPLAAELPRLKFIEPMAPALMEEPPAGNGWLHEIKHDGYRTQLHIQPSGIRAYTRNAFDWTTRYMPVIEAARSIQCTSAIIDGEMIVQDEQGRSDFHSLRGAIGSRPHDLVLMCFDLLHLNGRDLRSQPVEHRRDLLAQLLGPHDPHQPFQFSEHVVGGGAEFFDAVDKMGLEGIVSKRLGSRYRSGPTKAWVKTKTFIEEELVVIGTERGDKAPVALLARERDGNLEYAGGAMVTLRQPDRDRFWETTEALKLDKPPLPMKPRKDASWVRPSMHVTVRTLRGEEMLRHATVREIVG